MNDQPIAVVTGAGSGIGAAIARRLSELGMFVVATDIDPHAAEVTATACGGPSRAEGRPLDVTDGASSSAVADDIAARFGRLDIWVSNAGISKMTPFVDISGQDLDRTLSVNTKGPFLCGQAAARAMIALGRGGVIVNVASMAGKQGRVPYLSDYVASKFAVVGLTQAMAFELAPHGIRVNSVCPGYVATPMQDRELAWEAELRGSSHEQVLASWIDDTPLGRLEQPEDVAKVVGFLVGHDAGFITGEAIAVNGGAFMD